MLLVLRVLGGFLGRLAFYAGIRRQVTMENLALAFPDLSDSKKKRIAVRCFANLGRVFFEFLFLRFGPRVAIYNGLEINNLEVVIKAISRQNGAILLSGHLADWEWLALGCALRIDRPLDVIIKNQRSSIAENFMVRMRTRFGNRMLNAGDVRTIYRALGNKEILAILGDQSAGPDDVRVPFFGKSTPTFPGTARLALATRAPILFLQPYERTLKGYCCKFIEVPFDDLIGTSEDNVRELTARHTAILEQAIREKPELWLWQHRRWKHAS